jgi:hypothetical protein
MGDDSHVLISQLAARKGGFSPWKLLEVLAYLDPLGGGATRKIALPLQPGGNTQRAVGRVLARLVETADTAGEDRLQRIDACLADEDQQLTQFGTIGILHTGGDFLDGDPQLAGSSP